jgi:uncharacterized membrane protein YjdF
MSIRTFVDRIIRTFHPDHLAFIGCGAVIVLIWSGLKAPSAGSWVIYAIIDVLILLLLWRVAAQWNIKSQEAENLRVSVIVLAVVCCRYGRLGFHSAVIRLTRILRRE